ncbi:MAG: pilus assembly protein PilM [Oscillibacter sp.]|nr:pilus assembly protein PilM [Oscillibacter sp.]
MAKTILGIDIGTNRLKLAVLSKGRVKKTLSVPVPANLFRDGRITSPDAMAELLRETLNKNRIRVQDAAMILSDDPLYLRILNMPPMNEEQLTLNLPYEFNDYITGELKDYVFDYAVLSLPPAELLPKPEKGGKRKKKGKEPEIPEKPEPLSAPEDGEWGGNGEGQEGRDFGGAMELLAVAAPEDMILTAREVIRKAGMRLVRAAPLECALIAVIRASE